jgi:MoaA/NifB/PqqE/SkfB family radical SAM enzyme
MDRAILMDADIDRLLHMPFLPQLCLELNTSCNLGCVYCHFAPTTRRGKEAPPELLDRIKEFCRRFPIDHVTLAGDSETTLYAGWMEFARDLLDIGMKLRIISNFCKGLFSDDEIDVLSRFQEVVISLDSDNAELMKKVRYRADLRTIVTNLQRVRAAAVLKNRPMPRLVCNITAYDRNIVHIDRTVAFALASGFTLVQVNPFVELEEVPGGENDLRDNPNAWDVRKVDTLSPEAAMQAKEALERAVDLCRRHGVPITMQDRLHEQLNRCLTDAPPVSLSGSPPRPLESRRTKHCHFPWDYQQMTWNGDMLPCCIVKDQFIGNALDPGGVASGFNGPVMKQYRRGLLTGELMPACANCTYATDTTTRRLRNSVEAMLGLTGRPEPERLGNAT